MEDKDRILIMLNNMQKNVNNHKKDKKNTHDMLCFYDGYSAAVKEIKEKIIEMEEK